MAEGFEEVTGFGDFEGEGFGFGFDEADEQTVEPTPDLPPFDPASKVRASFWGCGLPPTPSPIFLTVTSPASLQPVVPIPKDVPEKRTHNSITLRWDPLGQGVTKLLVQCMPNPKRRAFSDGFDRSEKGGGKIFTLDPAQSTTGLTINDLKETTEYAFRLVAKNPAGFTEGKPLSVATIPFAPLRGDKSGWLLKLDEIKPKNQEEKTGTLRRLSQSMLGKAGPERLWFVLDGALLSWFDKVDGKEEGYCHLGKLRELSWPSVPGNTKFRLDFNDGKSMIEIGCVSEIPTVSNVEYFESWTKEITTVRARVGNAQALHRRTSTSVIS